jgi:hypothetical protein
MSIFYFSIWELLKKSEKMSLQHNALIYISWFIKVLLNFLFLFFKNNLGVFYVTII